jgi:Leucine-rich repeat (LRR) protein
MIVTYGLSTLDLNFSDLDDVVLIIYTNEISDEFILSIDDLLLSPNIKFETGLDKKIKFNVSLPVWKKFTENIKSLIFSGNLIENQFTYNHLECMKFLENLYIENMDYPFLNMEEIQHLSNLKRIYLNGNRLQ